MYSRAEVLEILSNDHRHFTAEHYGKDFHAVVPEELVQYWDITHNPTHWTEYIVEQHVSDEPYPLPPIDLREG